ncbi:MAG: class II glutamine amidotransferase [Lysobacterales bacterium]|jgi:glutamine amidotransferase
MCRWLAYSGNPIPLEAILVKPDHNLIDQSFSALSSTVPTNGDGFGVGWYGSRSEPGLFRSLRPAWNDSNLHDLAAHIDSALFLAHVRASSRATVQHTNCHPFRHDRWLFAHNGEIREIDRLHRDLLMQVAPDLFTGIQGTTDSELMFHLALSQGLEDDVGGALERMAGLVEHTAKERGVEAPLEMTLGLSDGESIWAVRYASDGKAPTLYHSRDVADLEAIIPEFIEIFGDHARVIVSEPIGRFSDAWAEVPQGTILQVKGGHIETRPFRPVPPNAV